MFSVEFIYVCSDLGGDGDRVRPNSAGDGRRAQVHGVSRAAAALRAALREEGGLPVPTRGGRQRVAGHGTRSGPRAVSKRSATAAITTVYVVGLFRDSATTLCLQGSSQGNNKYN